MRTKNVVDLTGVDRATLKFYEKEGLIDKPRRTSNGYRKYPDEVIDRIKFIKIAKNAGFTLKDIKELINLRKRRVSCKKGRDVALAKCSQLKEKKKEIQTMIKILEEFVHGCEKDLNRNCTFSFNSCCGNND